MAGMISSPDFHKLQKCNVGDRKYMINYLPDSILHYILSLLPTKDAVRTSILAKRWKYLWTCLSAFDFEICQSFIKKKENQIQTSANCLLDLVDRLLHKSNCAKRLRIAMLRRGITIDADKFNYFLSDAVKHKINDLELSLNLNAWFVLPRSFSASVSLNKLCLELLCVLYIPRDVCFPGLKTLILSRVTFANDKSLQRLFSGCLVLQELTLSFCDWKNIRQISVTMPTLRKLTIYFHPFGPDDLLDSIVKIDAVNLLSFSFISSLTVEFVLVNLTSIVDAFIDVSVTDYSPSEQPNAAPRAIKLLSGFAGAKSLRLSCDTIECVSYAKDTLHLLPSFHNLTRLDVHLGTCDFTSESLMDILQKMPKLEVLDIPEGFDPNICLDGEDWILNSVPCCFKSCLKLFCISNFYGGAAEIQLLKFLLKNATVLEKIQIFCLESLSDDLKKQADIRNQLQPVGLRSCVIKFQFFNRAALITDGDLQSNGSIIEKSWRLCTVQQVEDFKKIFGILPLWTSSIFLSIPIAIQNSLTILQALAMDRSLGPDFKIPAASVSVIVLLSTSIFLTFLDRLLWPGWQKLTRKTPTPLQRIGVGHVLNVLGMAVSALVESKRLKIAHGHSLHEQINPTVAMSVLWLFPQLVLVGVGEAFHFPGQVAFYYQQFPHSLRSLSTAMISMIIGIAFYLSTALIDQIRRSTDWLPDDINHGKVDNVYWMFVLFGGINFGYYLLCSTLYKYEKV